MQELVDGLRNAAADPPPSSIDLDRLITGEYRRKRIRTGVTTVLAVAALAASVAVSLALTTGGRSTAPPPPEFAASATSGSAAVSSAAPATPCPSPEVPDPAGGDLAVLTAQVAPCLAVMLPGAALTDPDTKAPGVRFIGDRRDRFKATVQVVDAAGTALLSFQYTLNACESVGGQMCTGPSTCPGTNSWGECRVSADGTKLFIQEGPLGPTLQNQLNVYRPDGSYLQLAATNGNDANGFITDDMKATATRVPLTVPQLIEIAAVIRLDK